MRILTFLTLALLAFSLTALDAEARRFGGTKSIGKQRQSINLNRQQQQSAPKSQQPGLAAAPAAAGAAASGSKWLGPLAGLAAGGLLASLLMGGAFDGIDMMDILVLLGLVAATFFIIRMLRRSSAGKQTLRSMQYSGTGGGVGGISFPQQEAAAPAGGAANASGINHDSNQPTHKDSPDIPADFDVESFLKQAKHSFIALQAANDARNLEDIRAYTTPELFSELSQQINERGDSAQQTEVIFINAALLDVITQGNQATANVRFTGELREAPDAQPESFDEIWYVEKDLVDSRSAWLLAGIQQTSDV